MKVSTFSVVILLLMSSVPVVPKGQFVQPLNMGMQVAIPYDIANIFNRPINFGPISALISTGSLLYILFFGVITSPFGYFFGIPSEKYVLGDTWPIKQDGKERIWDENNNHYNQPRNLRQDVTTVLPPRDFEEHVFSGRLGEDLRDDECRKMVICSAHNGLRNLPEWFMKGYKFFSKKLPQISSPYRSAILTGIENKESCEMAYPLCNDNLFAILVRAMVNMMPKWSRKKAIRNSHF